jgi:hypothetical protein
MQLVILFNLVQSNSQVRQNKIIYLPNVDNRLTEVPSLNEQWGALRKSPLTEMEAAATFMPQSCLHQRQSAPIMPQSCLTWGITASQEAVLPQPCPSLHSPRSGAPII